MNKKILSKQFIGLSTIVILLFLMKGSVAQTLMPCNVDAIDQEGNSFSFSLTKTTPGVVINPSTGVISGTSNAVGSHIIEVVATDEYGAVSDPYAYNLVVDSYCGDNLIQTPNSEGRGGLLDDGNEECDGLNGIAFTPSDSGPNKMYACMPSCPSSASSCLDTCTFADASNGGGYCGDGVVQTAFGETCDPNETKTDYETRTGSVVDNFTFAVMKQSCSPDCRLGCASDPDLARGCYLDINGNGIIDSGECQKGMYTCGAGDTLGCTDVFTSIIGTPIFDECCRGNIAELQDGNIAGVPYLPVRALTSDMGIGGYVMDHGSLVYYGSVFNCDDVCLRVGKICIGVGLSQQASNSCVSVMHDNGSNCNLNSNLASNDCKAGYLTGGTHCMETASTGFRIGETLCYCY